MQGTRRVWPLKTARHRGISRIWLGQSAIVPFSKLASSL
jgi:hypothetical protein